MDSPRSTATTFVLMATCYPRNITPFLLVSFCHPQMRPRSGISYYPRSRLVQVEWNNRTNYVQLGWSIGAQSSSALSLLYPECVTQQTESFRLPNVDSNIFMQHPLDYMQRLYDPPFSIHQFENCSKAIGSHQKLFFGVNGHLGTRSHQTLQKMPIRVVIEQYNFT